MSQGVLAYVLIGASAHESICSRKPHTKDVGIHARKSGVILKIIGMKERPIYVAFATQKGGVGKSAFTVLVASVMQYTKRYNVAIIDCDHPQYSIEALRVRERKHIDKEGFYRQITSNLYAENKHLSYPIKRARADNAIEVAENLLASSDEKFDIIFFDLPGTVNTQGILSTLSKVDYIFTPITADRFVLESSLSFASTIKEGIMINPAVRLKGIYLFWNLVDGRERTELYDHYESGINTLGLEVMQTTIPDTKKFRKEMSADQRIPFRSSLLPPDKRLIRGSRILDLVDEISTIINLAPHDE